MTAVVFNWAFGTDRFISEGASALFYAGILFSMVFLGKNIFRFASIFLVQDFFLVIAQPLPPHQK